MDFVFIPVSRLQKSNTLKVESFAGRKFGGDKLLRTAMVKIKFCGYKFSRMPSISPLFHRFGAVFYMF